MKYRIASRTGEDAGRELMALAEDAGSAGCRLFANCKQPLLHWGRRLTAGGVFLLAAWLAFGVVAGPNGWLAYRGKVIENQKLLRQIDQLQKENDQLEESVKKFKNDPQTIEREAREHFRWVKPGEIVYLRPEKKSPPPPPPANPTAEKQ
jgi:cell division protein FtsB